MLLVYKDTHSGIVKVVIWCLVVLVYIWGGVVGYIMVSNNILQKLFLVIIISIQFMLRIFGWVGTKILPMFIIIYECSPDYWIFIT